MTLLAHIEAIALAFAKAMRHPEPDVWAKEVAEHFEAPAEPVVEAATSSAPQTPVAAPVAAEAAPAATPATGT